MEIRRHTAEDILRHQIQNCGVISIHPNQIIPQPLWDNGYTWTKYGIDHFITKTPAQIDQLDNAVAIAPTDYPVLITGPTGTGKELIARMMHRRPDPASYIAINMAAIPSSLFEAAMFGYTRGSFTGASEDRQGYFDLANNGTIFLDEIASIPLEYQSKLLRVLDTGTYWPVGATKPRTSSFRVVAATRYDIQARVDSGEFLEDLYARLFYYEIRTIGLRSRPDDILPILDTFNCRVPPSPEFNNRYTWRYNVRALQKWAAKVEMFGPKEEEDEYQTTTHT